MNQLPRCSFLLFVLLAALLLPCQVTAQTLLVPAFALADSSTRSAAIARLAQLRTVQGTRGDTTPSDRALDAQYEIYLKSPGQQINYGSGKDVNDETVADAGEPLRIRWSNRGWLELPVRQ